MIGDREYWGKGFGSDALITMVHHIFYEVRLRRIYLHTLDSNIRAQRCFEKCGFAACGYLARRGYKFIVMELYPSWLESDWVSLNSQSHKTPKKEPRD